MSILRRADRVLRRVAERLFGPMTSWRLAAAFAGHPRKRCDACGRLDITTECRGWHDDGSPMKTCLPCGVPSGERDAGPQLSEEPENA